MVKTHKRASSRQSTPQSVATSAFSVYKQSAPQENSQENQTFYGQSAGTSQATKSNVPFSAPMKQISGKTVFPFRLSSRKRKKKLKKDADAVPEECRRSSLTSNGSSFQSGASTSTAGEKGFAFPFGRGKLRASIIGDKKLKVLKEPRIIENPKAGITLNSPKRKYKASDKSVELSTSQSLTGFEDDSDDGSPFINENLDPNSNNLKAKFPEGMELSADLMDESGSPVLKKSRLDAEEEDQSETLSATTSMEKISSKHSSPVHAVNTTTAPSLVQKATGKILKMPFPAGNSEEDGRMLLKWLIHPMSDSHFMSSIWEKKPALIRRRIPTYVNGLFSTEEFNRILHECNVQYGVNLDITSYQDGVRETHNCEGKVYPVVVWDYYKNGCSLRIKNPQAFSKPVWKLCATLQEYFKSMVGANIYLTPAGTQGFAPHYDDIEAFVLQLEGKKHWHLYNPRSKAETLPRYSSPNFSKDDIGKEIFNAVLGPGDLLYFPRGYIHQAQAVPDTHSLHITISTYQKTSWADVLEDLVPKALQRAIEEDVELRKGVPFDYISAMGYQNAKTAEPARRKEILSKISSFFQKLADYADVDENADERGKAFLYDSLPPALTQEERARTVLGATVRLAKLGEPASCHCDIDLDTRVRVVRRNAVRLVKEMEEGDEEPTYYVYHCMQNPRTYHTEEPKYFALTKECAPVLEFLINSYPEYKAVSSVPLESDEDKMNVICDLFEKGILLLEDRVKVVEQNNIGTAV